MGSSAALKNCTDNLEFGFDRDIYWRKVPPDVQEYTSSCPLHPITVKHGIALEMVFTYKVSMSGTKPCFGDGNDSKIILNCNRGPKIFHLVAN